MNELHLFAGAGGGILGSVLLGHKIVGAVEWEEYPCRVLEQRQRDGCLEQFPIFQMDIREFNRRVAPLYRHLVDVISAGFPCQPFSLAGKRNILRGESDSRNLWPETLDSICIIQPRYVLLENVPGLLSTGYISRILGDLFDSGYDAQWQTVSAAECGSLHRRDRLWIFAYPISLRFQGKWPATQKPWSWEQFEGLVQAELRVSVSSGSSGGVAYRYANRMDRLKALGNAQVPIVAATAWKILAGE